ncbi:hypothetical protein BpHYR1_018327 [Brachionus plicatilis]|uniref:Uncharacterized protein n=1 Tax=Brachionus plicatilis TaxID=10195 RepID=A0A3M7SPI8_BRAPC|nr:hypothetical protein BpHYR1_018327 [Brachionus plicatilis]
MQRIKTKIMQINSLINRISKSVNQQGSALIIIKQIVEIKYSNFSPYLLSVSYNHHSKRFSKSQRFKQLSLRYIQNALINKNPIILGSFDENNARNLSLKTEKLNQIRNFFITQD